MGSRINLQGLVVGNVLVLSPAPSENRPGLKRAVVTRARWNTLCNCGAEGVLLASTLRRGVIHGKTDLRCGKACGVKTLKVRDSMPTVCGCGVAIKTQRQSLSNGATPRCHKCKAEHMVTFLRGKEAHNRIPDEESGFRALLARYKAGCQYKAVACAWELSEESFRALTKKPCTYCGAPPGQSTRQLQNNKRVKVAREGYTYSGVDRIDSTKGYEEGNCTPCCSTCNYMKRHHSVDTFLEHVGKIAKHQAKDVR